MFLVLVKPGRQLCILTGEVGDFLQEASASLANNHIEKYISCHWLNLQSEKSDWSSGILLGIFTGFIHLYKLFLFNE